MGGNFSMNCFPTDNEAEQEETKDLATTEAPERQQENPTPEAAGISEVAEGEEPRALTKLDRKRVDSVWDEVRGSGERPSDDFIRKAIKKDDFDGSGILEKTECKRLCESFQLRAKKNGDSFESWEAVFQFLDKNCDDTLDFDDIKYTMTVMWLMTKDRVSLQRLNACEEKTTGGSEGSAPAVAEAEV